MATAGAHSSLAPWMGGAASTSSSTTTGPRSLLVPWMGGGATRGSSTAGYRSPLAQWMGGASTRGAAATAGVRSMLAPWMGGAATRANTPSTGVKNHLNLTLRQMLVDYYEKAFEKKKIEAAPIGKRKTLTLKKADAKEVEIQERTAKVSEMLAKAEESLANKNDAMVARLVDSAIKSGQLVTNFDDFERERAARQKRRDDDDLLLYSTIL